jgi:hypothetical protein
MLNTTGIDHRTIRPRDHFRARSYNLDRQLKGLIGHLFVRYPVPGFLADTCLKWPAHRPFRARQSLYREWFITAAQGGSLQKAMKGVLAAKEVALFLKGPYPEVHQNIWWARLRYAGVPETTARTLGRTVYADRYFDDPDGRLHEVMHFFANHHSKLERRTEADLADFIRYKLDNEAQFRFKARTPASMIELMEQWHVLLQKAQIDRVMEWEGLNFGLWELTEGRRRHRVIELLSNRDLLQEGRKLHHCVYSYSGRCAQRRTSIFSLRSYRLNPTGCLDEAEQPLFHETEYARATIEVNRSRMQVEQFRTLLNAPPDSDQRRLLNLWAEEKKLRLTSTAYTRIA